MPSLSDVFRVLERMRDDGVVSDYAVGGATAVLFYAEPHHIEARVPDDV